MPTGAMAIAISQIVEVKNHGIDHSRVTLNAGYDRARAKRRIATKCLDCLGIIVWVVRYSIIQRWHSVNRGDGQAFPLAFVRSVEKRFVLRDRSADRSPKLVVAKRVFRLAHVIKIISRVQHSIAKILEQTAV